MAFTVTARGTGVDSGNVTSFTVTPTGNIAAGSAIVLCFILGANITGLSISDNQGVGNTYSSFGNGTLVIAYCLNSGGLDTSHHITVSVTSSQAYNYSLLEVAGGSANLDGTNNAASTSVSLTTTNANDCLIAAGGNAAGASSTLSGGGFTAIGGVSGGGQSMSIVPAYRIVSATGTYTPTWGNINNCAIMAIKAPAAAGPRELTLTGAGK